MNKFFRSSILFSFFIGFALTSCSKEDNEPDVPLLTNSFMAPTVLSGTAVQNGVMLSWNSVNDAEFYTVSRASSLNGNAVSLGYIGNSGKIYDTSVVDTDPLDGDNYYFINSCKNLVGNRYEISPKSAPIYVHYTRNNNPGGGGNENPGGGNNTNPGGDTNKTPSAPTGLSATPDGPSTAPFARLNWTSVSNATSYTVFRSSSANGSYTQIGKTSYNGYSDENVKYGNTYYYKVKASNSYGTSDYSSYAVCQFTDRRTPGPVSYGSCTVSGTSMTLRWSVPKDASYGTPTKATLRVRHPDTGNYVNLQTLSGTATSASFTYTPWVDKDGYVYAGIILENENGSGGGTPKIYDTKNKRWIN